MDISMFLAQSSSSSDAMPPAVAMLFGGVYMVVWLVVYLAMGFALMTIANKLGIENGWLGFIPIANIYLMTQCAGLDWWYLLLCFIPCVNIFVLIYLWWKIAERRGKPGPVALAILIPFIGPIAVPLYIALAD